MSNRMKTIRHEEEFDAEPLPRRSDGLHARFVRGILCSVADALAQQQASADKTERPPLRQGSPGPGPENTARSN